MLTAPMVGGDLAITSLKEPGELVKPGDVVIEFDTTAQEYNLREAEADLAEAAQQVIKAEADAEADAEKIIPSIADEDLNVDGETFDRSRVDIGAYTPTLRCSAARSPALSSFRAFIGSFPDWLTCVIDMRAPLT